MARSTKVVYFIAGLLLSSLVSLAVAISYDAAPAAAPALASDAMRMRAIVHRQYGSPAVLALAEVAKPRPAQNQLLIRVQAAAINPLDWHFMRGKPYVMRLQTGIGKPKDVRVGVDFSGTVEAVGQDIRQFKVGDAIFGTADGALAEYAISTEAGLALKPSNMTFQQAASVPVAGITALQALRDQGKLRPGQKVLINGASGGVGTFAVQIAKSLGADVTGVCSTANVAMVRSIGADHVIDYSKENYTSGADRYDVIIDTVGNQSLLNSLRVLSAQGILVIVGAPSDNRWLGPLTRMLKGFVIAPFVSQQIVSFIADAGKTDDLNTLRDLLQSGTLLPVVDRQYNLTETPAAMRYLEMGHARGKVVVNVE